MAQLAYNIINMKDIKVIIIAFLAGISIFCVASFISLLKEKNSLQEEVRLRKIEVGGLTNEKQNFMQALEKEKQLSGELTSKNSRLKRNLSSGSNRLNKLFTQYSRETAQTAVLKAENAALRQEKDKLAMDLNQAVRDRQGLQVRLSSVTELRKAMRELKKRKRDGTLVRNLEGNQGFIVKNGKSTYSSSVKIEVIPAAANE